MRTINPSEQDIAAFSAADVDGKPIVMVNLLKFREHTEAGESGRKAYGRYSKAVLPLLWETGGQILWQGNVRTVFIAPAGEDWDEVLLVYYPNRQAFIRMVGSAAYQQVMPFRTAALVDSRLIESKARWLPKPLLGLARGAVRIKSMLLPQFK